MGLLTGIVDGMGLGGLLHPPSPPPSLLGLDPSQGGISVTQDPRAQLMQLLASARQQSSAALPPQQQGAPMPPPGMPAQGDAGYGPPPPTPSPHGGGLGGTIGSAVGNLIGLPFNIVNAYASRFAEVPKAIQFEEAKRAYELNAMRLNQGLLGGLMGPNSPLFGSPAPASAGGPPPPVQGDAGPPPQAFPDPPLALPPPPISGGQGTPPTPPPAPMAAQPDGMAQPPPWPARCPHRRCRWLAALRRPPSRPALTSATLAHSARSRPSICWAIRPARR